MSWNKAHFKTIGNIFKATKPPKGSSKDRHFQWSFMLDATLITMAKENPGFNATKFLEAVGYDQSEKE